jgi:anti-sigma regulatory factor (Ser/Thr protein kinase)
VKDEGWRSGVTTLSLPAHPAAVRRARTFARDCCLNAGVTTEVTDTVVLLISEAVTNAFVHGRSDARLRITVTGSDVLVEVGDDNSRHPRRVTQDDDALDGRGMLLMVALARHWGVRDEVLGKTVWFEVARVPASSAGMG